jgi:hypothetical protein
MKKPISILMSFLLSLSFVFATACGDTSSNSGGGQGGSQISIGANGNWFIDDVDTGVKAAGDIGEWVHLVGTYDKANSVIKLYLNGEMVSSSSVTTAYKPPSLTAQFFALGADSWTEDRLEHYSNTRIAGCGVYSCALTAEQVATLYGAK